MQAWICMWMSSREPNAPPDTGEVQPDLVLGQSEARRDLLAVDVQPLRRDVEVDAAVLGRHRQTRLRPERRLVLHRRLVVAVDPDVRLGGVGLAVDDVHVTQDVPELVQARRLRRQRLLHVVDAGQLLELDGDPSYRPPGDLRCRGGEDGDRLARIAHDVLGEDRLVEKVQPEAVLARHVGAEHDRHHAGGRGRPRDVDALDAGVGHPGAQGCPEEHPFAVQIARVGERARDLRFPVDARSGFSDPASGPDGGDRVQRISLGPNASGPAPSRHRPAPERFDSGADAGGDGQRVRAFRNPHRGWVRPLRGAARPCGSSNAK